MIFNSEDDLKQDFGIIAIDIHLVQKDILEEGSDKEFYGTRVKHLHSELIQVNKQKSQYKVLIQGLQRILVKNFVKEGSMMRGQAVFIDDDISTKKQQEILKSPEFAEFLSLHQKYQLLLPKTAKALPNAQQIKDLNQLVFQTIAVLEASFEQNKKFLEINSIEERVAFLSMILKEKLVSISQQNQLSHIAVLNLHSPKQIELAFNILKSHEELIPPKIYNVIERILTKMKEKDTLSVNKDQEQ